MIPAKDKSTFTIILRFLNKQTYCEIWAAILCMLFAGIKGVSHKLVVCLNLVTLDVKFKFFNSMQCPCTAYDLANQNIVNI